MPTADASLLAYYQMNEPNGTVLFNHAVVTTPIYEQVLLRQPQQHLVVVG
ncbi:MAG: hypothetical protein IPN94_23660 [Sphingobacteriales bacterium]|nr:hypothetical protein [Sphingobacteriales bacterium]